MVSGPRARLTREGWYYLAFTLFILGGAALRQINLLVVLGGMMAAPMLFSWRCGVLSLRMTAVRRLLPKRIFSGQPALVTVEVNNNRRRTTSWMLVIDDQLTRHESGTDQRQRVKGRSTCIVPTLNPQSSCTPKYRVQFGQRGRYDFGPLRISTLFPLGLLRVMRTFRVSDSLLVYPQIGRLLPPWHRLMESENPGVQYASARRGYADGDYYALRDWQAGDNRRWIHWRTTARRGRLAVRQFERQNKPDFALLIDPWVGTGKGWQDVERAISFAATVVVDLSHEGSQEITFGVADGQADFETHTNSRIFANKLLERLAAAGESNNNQPLLRLLAAAQRDVRSRTHLVIISSRSKTEATEAFHSAASDNSDSLATLARSTWIDCSSDQWRKYFRWDNDV